jgi:hypothetical protein
MQTLRSGDSKPTSLMYVGLSSRGARELFPQAVSPSRQCPRQYDYLIYSNVFLLCWGEK